MDFEMDQTQALPMDDDDDPEEQSPPDTVVSKKAIIWITAIQWIFQNGLHIEMLHKDNLLHSTHISMYCICCNVVA